MQKIYRILRNNKEQGPFSLDELTGLSLKPTDLVWQDGKSAAWLYPSEIDSLREHVPDPASAVKSISSPKPVMQTAAVREVECIEEDTLTAEKLERKAEEIYKRVQAYAQKNPDEVQTKYARSLDDLKQEYADWLHKKKRKTKAGGAVWMTAAGVLVIITVLFFVFNEQQKPGRTTTLISEKSIQQEPLNLPAARNQKNDVVISSEASPTRKNRSSSVDEFIDSVRRVLALQEAGRNRINYTHTSPTRKIERSKTTIPPKDSITHSTASKPLSGMVDMHGRYISGENGRGLERVEVIIENNSLESLKSVAVDIFYYKKGERLFDKSTIYFNDISPGNTYTLSLPANKKAITARFKLGLVVANE